MLAKRIVPCLDVRNGRVVKGKQFKHLQDVDDPVSLGKFYSDQLADELVFYDITATHEKRHIFLDVVRAVAETITIPFTIGGGIASIDDFHQVLRAGADKVSVNSAAVRRPELIREAAQRLAASVSSCLSMPSATTMAAGRYTSKGDVRIPASTPWLGPNRALL